MELLLVEAVPEGAHEHHIAGPIEGYHSLAEFGLLAREYLDVNLNLLEDVRIYVALSRIHYDLFALKIDLEILGSPLFQE